MGDLRATASKRVAPRRWRRANRSSRFTRRNWRKSLRKALLGSRARGDRALFTTKSQTLLTDPNLAARMGEARRSRAEERFSVARMAEMHARGVSGVSRSKRSTDEHR